MFVVYLNYQYIFDCFWNFWCQSPLLFDVSLRSIIAVILYLKMEMGSISQQSYCNSLLSVTKERIGTLYIFFGFIVDLRIDHWYTSHGDSPSTTLVRIHIFSSVYNDTILFKFDSKLCVYLTLRHQFFVFKILDSIWLLPIA